MSLNTDDLDADTLKADSLHGISSEKPTKRQCLQSRADVLDEEDLEEIAPAALALEPASSLVLDAIYTHQSGRTTRDEKQSERQVDIELACKQEDSTKEKPRKRKPIGWFHQLCFIKELENPYQYSRRVKMFLVFIFAFGGMVPAMGSAVFYPAVKSISAEFNATATVINLSVGFYMFSLGIFPLWWSYGSEIAGRRAVYVISFFLFTVFNIGCARASSITMLIIFRILSGGAAASSQSIGAGSIGDIFIPTERGQANGWFYLGPLCGPMMAPVIAGALNDRWGWRSTQYFLIIIGGASFLLMLFFLPETLTPITVSVEEIETRNQRKNANKFKYYTAESYRFFLGPFQSFELLKYPSFLFAIAYNSFGYGCLYVLNNSIPQLFGYSPYNFSSIITGLLYLPNGIGYFCGSLIGGRWSDRILKNYMKSNNGQLIPEARLAENMISAGIIVCAGMILFGWTAEKKLFWFVPIIGTFMFGVGSLIIFTTTLTFLIDSMPKRRSAAASLNTFVRCITAAVGTFVTVPLIDGMGFGWLFTMLTFIGLIFLALQFYVRANGPRWRASMGMEVG
ncbi:major facilitator superfamily domain-containing protein [Lipomyces oligophaga]|uniref:major facilitator superfamily domain-containing protein n=1 Tax=Lipomyces oligophaga TaxID=45792 RepID=UPI0034CF526D